MVCAPVERRTNKPVESSRIFMGASVYIVRCEILTQRCLHRLANFNGAASRRRYASTALEITSQAHREDERRHQNRKRDQCRVFSYLAGHFLQVWSNRTHSDDIVIVDPFYRCAVPATKVKRI